MGVNRNKCVNRKDFNPVAARPRGEIGIIPHRGNRGREGRGDGFTERERDYENKSSAF